jgi:hypothetical protein
VSDAIGRLYEEPSVQSLMTAISDWESDGEPHDRHLARRRAESFSQDVFRARILDLLARVTGPGSHHAVPPAPHIEPVPSGRPA